MATFKHSFQFLLLCSLMIASITGATANADDVPSSSSTHNLRGGRPLQQRETLHPHAKLYGESVSLPLTLQVRVSPLPSLFVPTTITEGEAAVDNRAVQCLVRSFQAMQQDFNGGSSQVKLSTVSVTHREIHQRDRSLELAEQEQSNSMKRTGTGTDAAAPPTKTNSENVNIVEDMDPEDAASILHFMTNLMHAFLLKLGLIHDEDVPEQPRHNSTANGTTTPTITSPSLNQPTATHLASSGYSYNLPIVHLDGACFDCPRDDDEPAFPVENLQNDNDDDQEQPPQDSVSPSPAPVPAKEIPSATTAPTGTGCGPFCPPQEDDDEEDRILPPSQADPKPEVSTVAPKNSSSDASCGDLCPPDDDDESPFVLSSSETQPEPEVPPTASSGSTISSAASSCGKLCPHADDDDGGFRGRSLTEERKTAQTEEGLWEIDSRIESFLLQSSATESQESWWRIFQAETNVLGWADQFCDCFVAEAFEVAGDTFSTAHDYDSVHPLCQIRVIAPVFD